MHLPESRTTLAGHSCPTCDCVNRLERYPGSSRNVSLLSISTKMVKGDSLGWEDPEPTTCAWRALGQGRPAMPVYCNGVMCCYSNGRSLMNGGNCSSFCPGSRRRQKLLLPQQTMPLCGCQRPAACTGPALCKPPITTLGSGATASGTLPQWATHTSPQARLEKWQGHQNLQVGHTGKLPALAEVQG